VTEESGTRTWQCSNCDNHVKPARGYLGGGVLCNECGDELVEANKV